MKTEYCNGLRIKTDSEQKYTQDETNFQDWFYSDKILDTTSDSEEK